MTHIFANILVFVSPEWLGMQYRKYEKGCGRLRAFVTWKEIQDIQHHALCNEIKDQCLIYLWQIDDTFLKKSLS